MLSQYQSILPKGVKRKQCQDLCELNTTSELPSIFGGHEPFMSAAQRTGRARGLGAVDHSKVVILAGGNLFKSYDQLNLLFYLLQFLPC